MAMLTWERKDGQRMVFHLQGIEATIGRDIGNVVRIESGYVSKRHAVVRLGPQGYSITDLNSSNGTFVNSQRVSLSLLKDGDRVELGSEVLVFANPVAGTPPGPPQTMAGSKRNPKVLILAGAGTIIVLLLFVLILVGSRAGKRRDTAATEPAAAPAPAAAAPVMISPDVNAPPTAQPDTVFGGSAPAGGGFETAPPAGAEPPVAAPPAGGAAAAQDSTIDNRPLPSNDPMALYEMALSHVAGNRLVEARRLLRASVRIDPGNASAQQRLRQVEATIQVQADQHMAAGQRAFTYLRFDDAAIEFEQVMQMVPPTDPRYQQAAAGLRRARERIAR